MHSAIGKGHLSLRSTPVVARVFLVVARCTYYGIIHIGQMVNYQIHFEHAR